ncbi:class I SAM-dependent methyltransferase [Stappia sp. WLB 29]|uniref:class I SAM-dependent methyltransferase n=1 Tax=Stappia sp. WLB 29 TaxID=2925220 RepID=UPI0020BF3739|nr:class I SAM-dependent methyltransferase [Stappia sp. WLB 29]
MALIAQYFIPFISYPYTGETIDCDLCGCPDHKVICRHDRRFKKLQTVACLQCGLMRTNPMPTKAEIEEYYSNVYRLDYGLTLSRPSKRHLNRSHDQAKSRMELLRPVLKPGARVLDFGCGAGVFLHHAKTAGYETLGIEPGSQFASFARDELGVEVINDIWEQVELPHNFDVITAVEVLEHLRHPVLAMRWLADALANDGILYVTVPNMLPSKKETFRRFHFAHLYQFTPTTLTWVAAAAGLEPDPRFEPNGTRIVFRKTEKGPCLPDFNLNYGEGMCEQYAHASVSQYLLSGRWLRSMGSRLTKSIRDTIR